MFLGIFTVGKYLRILRHTIRVYLLSSQFTNIVSEWSDLNDGVPQNVSQSISTIFSDVFPIKTKHSEHVIAIIESALLSQLCLVFYDLKLTPIAQPSYTILTDLMLENAFNRCGCHRHPSVFFDLCEEYQLFVKSAHIIQKHWRIVVSDPNYNVCKTRLLREFVELNN